MAQVGQRCCVGVLCPGRNTVVAHAHQSARQYKQDPNKGANKDLNNYSNKKIPKIPKIPFTLPSRSLLRTPFFTLPSSHSPCQRNTVARSMGLAPPPRVLRCASAWASLPKTSSNWSVVNRGLVSGWRHHSKNTAYLDSLLATNTSYDCIGQ